MPLDEIKKSKALFLTIADIAPILGSCPQTLRVTMRTRPQLIGFPFICTGNRIKIPRKQFLKFLGEDVE